MFLVLAGALAVGLSIGLLGAGGTLLSVPVLTMLVGQDEKIAIAESLVVAGWAGLVTLLPYTRRRLVDWRAVLLFAPPGMAGSWIGARLSAGVPGEWQIALLAVVMLVAALSLGRGRGAALLPEGGERPPLGARRTGLLLLLGLALGLLTGLVGIGGSFLVVPAFVALAGMPLRIAVGTSLALLVLRAGVGFAAYGPVLSDLGLAVDWGVTLVFAALATVGGVVGGAIGWRLPAKTLQSALVSVLVAMSGLMALAGLIGR